MRACEEALRGQKCPESTGRSKSCLTPATPWTVAHQVPLSMRFPRQEYWNGLPFPTPIYNIYTYQFSSVSQSIMSDSLQPHGLQNARPPCPSLTPGVYSNSCPLSWWCHPTISSSVVSSIHLQSFPASGSFQMSQFFTSGGQSIGVSASTSVLPMNIQD